MVHVMNATLGDPDQFLDLFLLERREVTGPMRGPQGDLGPFCYQFLCEMRNLTGQVANIQVQEVMITELVMWTISLAGLWILEGILVVHPDLVLDPKVCWMHWLNWYTDW